MLSPFLCRANSRARFVSLRPCHRGLACLGLLACLGCGADETARVSVFPVQGKITFKGQAIPGAFVSLHPKTPLANVPNPRANVEKDGVFNVSTFSGGDGAPEGEYVLTVQWYKPIKNGADVVAGPNVIPRKYTAPQTSDITIRVAAGENTLKPIQL